ncbi:MAG: 3-hydroxybutyryl-CoA dehydrogenase, partial [Deltaproteobacteria bacterium]
MEINRVAVIGMGTMGSQIGIVCARGGFMTSMADASIKLIEKGLNNIKSFLTNQIKKGKMTEGEKENILSRIKTTTNLDEALSGAELMIEAVYEDIEVKKEIFKKADLTCPKETILTSNTSTLSITEMGAA